MAFTLPLEPSVLTGIDHARFPLIMKSLLQIEQGGAREAIASWPRIPDSSLTGIESRDLPLSNVPAVESVMLRAPEADLPPLFDRPVSNLENIGAVDPATSKEQTNPWPWVKGLAAAAGAALAFEGMWHAGRSLAVRGFLRSLGLLSVLLCAGVSGLLGGAGRARGDVDIIFAGSGSNAVPAAGARFNRLSREVTSRTSITVSPVPQVWNPASLAVGAEKPSGIDQPWLWSNGLQPVLAGGGPTPVSGVAGRLSPVTGRWLRRGGFLVIEGVSNKEILDAAFKVEFPTGSWAPVPTDHELMRSFYLLDSLPACAPAIWHQFDFDGRVAAVAIPQRLTEMLRDGAAVEATRCPGERLGKSPATLDGREKGYRAFVNLLMVALTTDYKKDQVHLPEILKRLR